ncbi:MAG: protein kinase [Candidatus Thiodiazotropha sp. (ex Lucinoma borealis)]|nr:protein kinase [Candidatus Thiodiazotropha sp. (ex Lucinoma borealis)]
MATLNPGTPIPGYTIIRKVGSGGSADVYLAVQQNLNRRVALKLVKGILTSDPKFGARFKREGRIIAQLNHPHIIPVYDIGEFNSQYFMAMEYLSGGDLRSQAEQLTLKDLLQVILQITQALQVAHDRGFIHRDIKPTNILYRNPKHAVLTDFGIARQAESLTHMTVTGAMLGTPAYMSPEQISGRTLDGRADIYSLGITLFELLTGYQPYRGESMMNVAMQHISADIPHLPKATSRLQNLVDQLLAKDPDDRITSAEALGNELRSIIDLPEKLTAPLISLWPENVPEINSSTNFTRELGQARNTKKKSSKTWLIAGTAAVSLIAALGIGTWYAISSPPNTDSDKIPTSQTGNNPNSVIASQDLETPPWQETLTRANQLFEQDKLVAPEDSNALALYRQVLDQDSGNIIANNGQQSILRRLVLEVEQLILTQSLDEANQQLDALNNLWPDEEQLKELRDQIAKSRQRIEARNLAVADAAKQRKINQYLQAATSSMIAGQYLKPQNDSALNYFKKVLLLESKNQTAERGLSQIAEALIAQIQTAISNNDFSLAESLLKDLRSVDPIHEQLQTSADDIATAKVTFAQKKIERQRLEKLHLQINQLQERNSQWRVSTGNLKAQSNYGNQLVADIARVLDDHPENNQLRTLYDSVNQRLNEIVAQQKQRPSRKPIIGGF